MTILCATDLLSRSDAAMERAGLLADALQRDLSMLHVVAPLSSETAMMDEARLAGLQLKERTREPRWRHNVKPNLMVRTGVPSDVVPETADELAASVVVIGAHRRRSLRQAFTGSIAERLAETRRYPMLIVRRKPKDTYRRVVLALDLGQASGEVVRYAETAGLFADTGRRTIVHAYEQRYHDAFRYIHGDVVTASDALSPNWRRDYRNSVTDILVTASDRPSLYDIVLKEGRPASVILNHVKAHEPDLLVMGTRGGGKIHRAFLGSVAREVMQQARCDVLLVPRGVMSTRSSVTLAQPSRMSEVLGSGLTTNRGA